MYLNFDVHTLFKYMAFFSAMTNIEDEIKSNSNEGSYQTIESEVETESKSDSD